MRIGPAANVARLNVAEDITALWTFTNVLGLLTDIIGERTGGAGVTIDGVQLRDTAVGFLGLASAANRILGSDVIGDADERFRLHAGGIMQWGDGTGARDTTLFRAAASELATDDDFNVGGALDLGGDVELAERTIVLALGVNNNVATGTVSLQRLDTAAGVATMSGLAGGRTGRMLYVVNIGANTVSLLHQDVNSSAANRIITPGTVAYALAEGEGATLFYDNASSRWRVLDIA